jgi:hypothetical protein
LQLGVSDGKMSRFKCYDSDRKIQIFQIDKAHFADVAGSYIEKMQRSIAEKDVLVGRIIMFKHTPTAILINELHFPLKLMVLLPV